MVYFGFREFRACGLGFWGLSVYGLGAKPGSEERDFRVWFHFSRGFKQNLIPCRSSIFLCSETTRKRSCYAG